MILAVLQARCTSSRLPGKVLFDILGTPMLVRQIERIRRSRRIDHLVVATSADKSDDNLAALCERVGVGCFRGSLSDVLDRFYRAALPFKPDHVVRLTGDCPLTDPEIIDRVIDAHLSGSCDYTSNIHPPTFPDGLDAEILTFKVLEKIWKEVSAPLQREHVTLFIAQNLRNFRTANVSGDRDLSSLRWTVDEPEDFRFVHSVYEALYPSRPVFDMANILALLQRRPELAEINSGFERNEALKKNQDPLRTSE